MNAQPSLFDYHYPGTPGHKERGGTSQEAAERMKSRADIIARKVLKALFERGDLSSDQTARVISDTPGNVRPRFSELKGCGLVEKTARRSENESGASAVVWRLTDAGRAAAQQEGHN